jgi:voltage-gated potassium channel
LTSAAGSALTLGLFHTFKVRMTARNDGSIGRDGASEKSMLGSFIHIFFRMVWHVRSVFLAMLALIIAGGVVIAGVEKIPIGGALYFAFITGLTIGYGDIVATTTFGRIVSVLLGFVGVLFTGLVIAVVVHAVREAWEKTKKPD